MACLPDSGTLAIGFYFVGCPLSGCCNDCNGRPVDVSGSMSMLKAATGVFFVVATCSVNTLGAAIRR